MGKWRITDFDICIGWGINGPLSRWIFSVDCLPPLSEISQRRKRGVFGSLLARITFLGLFIEIQLNTHGKTE